MGNISSWLFLIFVVIMPCGIIGGVLRFLTARKLEGTKYEHSLVEILTLTYSAILLFFAWLICMLSMSK